MAARALLALLAVCCAAAGVRGGMAEDRLDGTPAAAARPAVLPATAPGGQAPVAIPAHLKRITPEIAGKPCA